MCTVNKFILPFFNFERKKMTSFFHIKKRREKKKREMKRLILFSAFVLCFVQKSVLGQKYSMERQCQECIQSNQEWFVMPNCTAHCGNAVNWWRRVKANFTGDEVQTISDCSDPILDCKVIDGIVNPSFEVKAEVFGWELTHKESLCKQGINSCTSPSFEGENYLWLCGYTENCKSSVSQDNILFPRDATHLSLYVMPQFGNTNSALDVLIDDVFVFKLSSVQGISTSIDKYVPLDIYIKPYADGGRHKITFSFTEFYEQSIPGTVLIDYARFTKISGCKLSNKQITFYYLLLLLLLFYIISN